MKRVIAGRGEPRSTARPSDDTAEDRAILSYCLLLATLVAGFVTSLGLAETNPVLTTLVGILN